MVEAQSMSENLNMWKQMLIGLAVYGFVGTGIALAADNLEVTETNTPAVAKSQTFGESDVIKIPEGARITVLNNTTNATTNCAGPYSGPIGKCPGEPQCGLVSRLLGRCGATGNLTPGATRSLQQ
jgi:hypothetical protein